METTYSILIYTGDQLPEQYKSLIFAKWLRSLKKGNELYRKIDSRAYYDTYQLLIERILDKPDTKVRLAVLTDDHDVVLGFCIYRNEILDYVYVQQDIRKHGIGEKLLPKEIKVYTHLTKTADIIIANRKPKAIFNPFV
jgi:hypothetical protein